MPLYIYKHPEEEEYTEVLQTMMEDHVYVDSDGLEWKRVFTTPNMSIDSSIDPYNSREFIDKTANKNGTMGDMMDCAKELSHERAERNGGVDPIKENYYKKYSKDRNGAKHFSELKEKGNDIKNINIDLGG